MEDPHKAATVYEYIRIETIPCIRYLDLERVGEENGNEDKKCLNRRGNIRSNKNGPRGRPVSNADAPPLDTYLRIVSFLEKVSDPARIVYT